MASLLVELLTEELPPKSLATLSSSFAGSVFDGLAELGLVARSVACKRYATPRRLAVLIPSVLSQAPATEREVQGPPVNAPPAAIAGFAKKSGVAVEALERRQTPKGEVFVARVRAGGSSLDAAAGEVVEKALRKLPIPKVMRWGDGDAQFVRPVHRLVMLHGARVVPGSIFGLGSGNRTHGHRFMGKAQITLRNADDYETKLRRGGMVIADFAARRNEIESQLKSAAAREKASLGDYRELLDEVTALVEYPSVFVGRFDEKYLEVPSECLILSMRQHQRYFPLFGPGGKLLPRFLIVSNMKLADPRHIIGGNERVVGPRLEDARFFYNQDRKVRLEERVPQLGKVIFHRKLGTQRERADRIKLLAGKIARMLNAEAALAERAAELSKADLLTGMVGEFPELQGVMGRYYALHDGEPREVADAIEAHYRPRFAGDRLPEGPVSNAVALADKLDTLAGLFGIGERPTGDKDPYGLRRAALGVIRIVVERELQLPLQDLVRSAFQGYGGKIGDADAELLDFIFERFAGYLKESGYSTLQVDAVLSLRPARISLVPKQLEAVKAFQGLPEAASLVAANKRVANILKQAASKGEAFNRAQAGQLKEPAERNLFDALDKASQRASVLFDKGDYSGYLKAFAVLKPPVDAFFDSVMVMAEDPATRRNRLALLAELRDAMNRVADISKLAA